MKRLLLAALLVASPLSFAQTTLTAPQVLGCSLPAPAVPPQTTVFFAACKTPVFVPLNSTSALASGSKTSPIWTHSFTGYKATDLLVACPAGATVSGATCTYNGADASALVAQNQIAAFTVVKAATTTSGELRWGAPALNTDGTPLTDLAGFNVYEGNSPTTMTKIGSTDQNTFFYDFNLLNVGSTYSFAVTAVNSAGTESDQLVLTQGVTIPKTPAAPTNATLVVPAPSH